MKEFVRRRLAKAQRAVSSARRDLASRDFDFAAERAYYAMFYAAEALLAHHDLRFRSHGAVHGAFGQQFVKPGIIGVQHHRALLDAFEARQLATYGIDPDIAESHVARLIDSAEAFLATIRAIIEQPSS